LKLLFLPGITYLLQIENFGLGTARGKILKNGSLLLQLADMFMEEEGCKK